ncbi:MAG: TatD family hydrolase [Clostridia bacterium]|jgi:TatD DNase family protein|nr:TatD family hydrolase [Clostridia bacterium]
MLIDTHAHLTDPIFGGAQDIIDNMAADGLERIVAVGYNEFSSAYSVKIAEANDKIYAAVGVHPSDATSVGQGYLGTLAELAGSEKCVAVGEIGLDYHYDDTDKCAQRRVLHEQLEMVRTLRLPAIFHVREAYGDFYDIIRSHADCLPAGAVMHCFSGSKETALQYAAMGFYISFSGSCTFKNSKADEVIAALPLDRLLVETDCPYLAPTPYRGQTNYPKYVRCQAEKIAQVKNMPVEEIIEITKQNAYAAFPKMR